MLPLMEDIIHVQKLVDLLTRFNHAATITEEDLADHMPEEILRNIKEVLKTKQIFIDQRWKAIFNKFPKQMFSSLEMYVTYVIYACQEEASVNLNIFERFLSVLCLLIYITEETLKRTEVDLSKIISNIFMLMYRREMNETFGRRGGFHRFLEYINNPKYLAMRRFTDCLDSSCNPNAHFPESLRKKIEKLQREETGLSTHFKLEKAPEDNNSCFWAPKILKHIRFELPPFPRNAIETAMLYEAKMAELEKKTPKTELSVLKESLERYSRLFPDSETSGEVKQVADSAKLESTIEAVIKCNRSKNSDHVNKKHQKVQTETEIILERLKEKIMTLAEIVNKYENE